MAESDVYISYNISGTITVYVYYIKLEFFTIVYSIYGYLSWQ